MARHQQLSVKIPDWVEQSENLCLRSVAEDAYTAKGWADKYHAADNPSCATIYRAAMKCLSLMADSKTPMRDRCHEGDRAARKFWEAKVCARERTGRKHGRWSAV